MARESGQFNFSANLEVKKTAPLDARSVVQTYEELIDINTWKDSDGKVWLYDGLLVSVVNDSSKNGVYRLIDSDNYQSYSSWVAEGLRMPDGTSILGSNNKIQSQYLDLTSIETGVDLIPGDNVTIEDGVISVNIPSYVDDIIEGNLYELTDTNEEDASVSTTVFVKKIVTETGVSNEDDKIFVLDSNLTLDALTSKYIKGTGNLFSTTATEVTRATPGVIYVDNSSSPYKAYRYSGSNFVEMVTQSVLEIQSSDINALFQ